MMKKLLGITLVAALLAALPPLGLDNNYLRSATFDTVTVARRDTVWGIAARYTTDEGQASRLAAAIIEINGLGADGAIRVGQRLQVPVLRRDNAPQLAGR
ncbi:MAG: LysM peptidoglycan-binding domain-containing protein [Schwartzia sp.]|nr:LysM peptidoglycan-binding domain-containing protein [Schwartzia sp. (in: firmicutes)]